MQAMEWATFPPDYDGPEILAVSCKSNENIQLAIRDSKTPIKSLIQLWAVDVKQMSARMAYAIAYDDGPVMAMKFLPSGGFIPEKRLGLLAVASHSGDVNILPLPLLNVQPPKPLQAEENSHLVVKIQPKFILRVSPKGPLNQIVTQITWSQVRSKHIHLLRNQNNEIPFFPQSKGHALIVGGYANGMVVIWNLKNLSSPLLCHDGAENTKLLLPIKMFYNGHKCITRKSISVEHSSKLFSHFDSQF